MAILADNNISNYGETDMNDLLSKNFTAHEFRCRCGKCKFSGGAIKVEDVSLGLVVLLESLRADLLNAPITINSGRRCKDHNIAVRGAPESRHLEGDAADITAEGYSPAMVFLALEQHPMSERLGLSQYPTFVHVDVRGYKSRW